MHGELIARLEAATTDRQRELLLAEDDGIPLAVQGMFDLSEYEAQAAEIMEMTYDTH